MQQSPDGIVPQGLLEFPILSKRSVRNSLLTLILREEPEPLAMRLESVDLQPGTLPSDVLHPDPFVYFPEDALISLAHRLPTQSSVDVALVGRHGCVGPSELWGSRMQPRVMVPGQAWRLNWSEIQKMPDVYTRCLWRMSVVTQGLIRQMTQMAFCAQHHETNQRLSGWLLVCLDQCAVPALKLAAEALPRSVRQDRQALDTSLKQLHAEGAICWDGHTISHLQADRLTTQACDCHRVMTHFRG